MATNPHIYVDSNHGTNTGGTDTSLASQQTGAMSSLTASDVYDNLGSAIAGAAPSDGDTIYIADNHDSSYDNGAIPSVNLNGDLDSTGLLIISVDTTAIDSYKPGASDVMTDAADDWYFYNNTAIFGVIIGSGDNVIQTQGLATYIQLVDSTIMIAGNGDVGIWAFGDGGKIELVNTDMNFGATNCDGFVISDGCQVIWNGGALTGSAPTDLWSAPPGANGYGELIMTGVDLSSYAGTLFPTPTSDTHDRSFMKLINCRLNSSVTLTGTLSRTNHRFEMYGCDNDTDKKLYRFYIEDGAGTAKNNDSVYVTAGETWYGGTDHSSIQVDTKANCSHKIPFVFELPAQYVDLSSTDTDVLTIDMVTAETLVKHDLAAFLVYPDGTTATIPNWVSSGPSVSSYTGIDPLDTSTTMPASALGAGDWTGEPGTPNFYELVLDTSTDVGQATAVGVRIEVYKASIGPIYIHPLITVSAT